MIALLLSTLFAAATCLALGAIGSSWRSHGAALLELRGQIGECGQTRELRYRLITTTVGGIDTPASATVYRLEFKAPTRSLPLQPELRAAA
jgi:hypothetical protein